MQNSLDLGHFETEIFFFFCFVSDESISHPNQSLSNEDYTPYSVKPTAFRVQPLISMGLLD